MSLSEARELAAQHAANLAADIPNAKDRLEHIRLVTLAQEAQVVVDALMSVPEESGPGLLPTHF